MDWRIVAGLVGVGIVIGFVIRSSIGFIMKVAVVIIALAVFHVISPDGIPELVRQAFAWLYHLVTSQAKDVIPG